MKAFAIFVFFVVIPMTTLLARQTYRSGVEVVTVDVSVRSGNSPVTGLTAADFEVTDNGITQTIEAVSLQTLAIDVTLLLDVSKSVDGAMLQRLKLAVTETARQLRPADRLRLVAVHERVTQVFPWQAGGGLPPVDALTAEGATALYDGLAATLIRPNDPERRQLIVALTDGEDTLSILNVTTVKDIAQKSDAVLHVIEPVDPKLGVRPTDAALLDLTAVTGGQVFRIRLSDSISDAFSRALADFRTGYVLRYTPTGVAKPGRHTIVVTVKTGAYEVRARKGYEGG